MFNHGSDFTIKQHANRKYASPLYAFVRIGLVLDLWCFIITAFLSEPATKQDLFFKLVKALRTLVARGCSEERLTTGNPTADSHWGFGRWGGGKTVFRRHFEVEAFFESRQKNHFSNSGVASVAYLAQYRVSSLFLYIRRSRCEVDGWWISARFARVYGVM